MRLVLVSLLLTVALVPNAAAAACPGADPCPYTAVTQLSPPPGADEMRNPGPVAVGPAGAIWVADSGRGEIVRLSPSGAVQGAIGAGILDKPYVAALAVNPATGDVYAAEGYQGRVLRFSPNGQLLGSVPAGTALGQVTNPSGIAIQPGSGRVFVTESSGTRTLQSFSATLGGPIDESSVQAFGDGAQIAFDAAGTNLWALPSSNGLSKFPSAALNSAPTVTVCPGGSAVGECQLAGFAGGLAVDASGRVWVPDRFNNRIQRFNADGSNPVAYGAIGGGDLGFVLPLGIAADGATLLVSDYSGRLRRYDSSTMTLLSTVGGPSPSGLRAPRLALAPDGSVLEQDSGASLVRRVALDGSVLGSFGTAGTVGAQLFLPIGIAVDAGGNILQGDQLGRRLLKLTATGGLVWSAGPLNFPDPDRLANASAVATGPGNEAFVADANRQRVAVYSPAGTLVRTFGTDGTGDGQLRSPNGLAVDDGSVYVLDGQRGDVQRFTLAGAFQSKFGAPGGGPGEFVNPAGIAADGRGSIYVLDAGGSRVVVFGRDGTPRGAFAVAGTAPGQLNRPVAIAADARSVVVSDASGRVQRFVLPQPAAPASPGPGTQPAPTDRTPPAITLRVTRAKLGAVVRRGLRATCTSSEAGRCQVTAALTRSDARKLGLSPPRRARTLVVGRSKRVPVAPGRAAVLVVKLGTKPRAALGRRTVRAVRLRLEATASDAAGNTGRRATTLALKR